MRSPFSSGIAAKPLLKLEALHKLARRVGYPIDGCLRQSLPQGCLRVAEHDPKSRSIHLLVPRADRAGQLGNLEHVNRTSCKVEVGEALRYWIRRLGEDLHQHASR